MPFDNVEDVYALSPLQEGMLFHSATEESGVYVTQVVVELSGNLEVAAFRGAWDQLLSRHASLRTAFLWDGLDEPLQVVRGQVELEWAEHDWRRESPERQSARFAGLLQRDRSRGFDLGSAPLMRMSLVQVGDRRWRWLWTLHHLVADGWSTRRLLTELTHLYTAAAGGAAAELGEPFSYRDYIAWHADRDREAIERFWRSELSGFDKPTRWGLVRPRTVAAEPRQTSLRLDAASSARLRELGAEERLTLATLVQGAWALLLARYCGCDDIVFGVTSSGRPAELAGIEEGVGLFINTLPLRVPLERNAVLVDWLEALQRRALARQQVESSSLREIQAWSSVAAGESLFDSIVVLENHPEEAPLPDAGFEIGDVAFHEQSNYPLALLAVPGERIELLLVYDASRVDVDDAERLPHQLATLLESFAERPRATLAELSPLSPAELKRVLVDWNDTADTGAEGDDVFALFERAAREHASSTALLSGEQALTYEELARHVAALAERLAELGVGPDVLVGLHAERSIELVVGLLAILAAGGAYLPLDPGYPRGYLEACVEEAPVSFVVTTEALRGSLPDSLPARPVAEVGGLAVLQTGTEPRDAAAIEPLAYVLFTSGSTGRPKGVAVTRCNLATSTLARHRFYGDVDRFLLLSSFAFDSSVAGIFWTLTTGGALVLEHEVERDLEALMRTIERQRVTHTLCLPTLYGLLLSEADPSVLSSLRTVIVAGEACPPALAGDHYDAAPGARLFNEYGPTEATVWCSVHEVDHESEGAVPIGRPIANTRLYVLDEWQRPQPPGAPGELYVAGAGVARGYFGRPRETEARFVTVELEGVGRERAYRTGDRTRYRQDGTLLFLGRVDSQLKLRGYRIEPEGIEESLRRDPRIVDAAVAVRTSAGGGHKRLIAWIATSTEPKTTETVDCEALRAWLAESLPEHSVPERIVVLDELPRTASGKVDRGALELPDSESRDSVAPRTEIERELAGIWGELLDCDEVGVHDNFFEMGGDSITSIQLVSRVRQAGYVVEPRHVALHPTVAELAAVAGTASEDTTKIEPFAGNVPLLPIQVWFLERELEAPHHWNQARRFEVAADFDSDRFEHALRLCVDHHDMLRASFERRPSGSWMQHVAPTGTVQPRLGILDLDADDEAGRSEDAARAIAEAQAAFDLATPPLLRALWLRPAGGGSGELLLTLHHLIIDTASWTPLLADLDQAYRTPDKPLPAPTRSYREWAAALADSPLLTEPDTELDPWLRSTEESFGELPVDLEPQQPPREADARSVEVVLDEGRTGALLQDSNRAYDTRVDELLLAALARAFERWTGRPALRVAVERHGRPEALDTSRTIGWFTISYPVVLDVSLGAGPGETIRAVRSQLRSVPGDGSGYGVLRYLSRAGGRADRLRACAEPQVLFNFMGRVHTALPSSLGRPLPGADAASRDPRNARSHLLEINAAVRDGKLVAEWTYCRTVHRRATIERVSREFIQALETLVDHCVELADGGITAADFPAAELDPADLERLLGSLDTSD